MRVGVGAGDQTIVGEAGQRNGPWAHPMPIVVGAPRSGTTLLRFMLDAHPDLAIPPETGFLALAESLTRECGDGAQDIRRRFYQAITAFPPEAPAWPDFGIHAGDLWAALAAIEPFRIDDGFRAFYRLYAGRFDKPRWGDKTPLYCLQMPAIERALPEARFIHIIRDGRDVALSLRPMWFAPGREIDVLAAYWRECVTTARRLGGECRHYLEVRFEDLVREPAHVLQQICDFIELDFRKEMLAYHGRVPQRLAEHRERVRTDGTVLVSHEARVRQQARTMTPPQESRAGSWRQAMSRDEQQRFDAVAGMLLRELGYADLSDNSDRRGVSTYTPDVSDVYF
jgi:hypothetical protein